MRIQVWGLTRNFGDLPGRHLVMVGGHHLVAPWEPGGPVITKRTHWAVIDGQGIRIPGWLYRWVGRT